MNNKKTEKTELKEDELKAWEELWELIINLTPCEGALEFNELKAEGAKLFSLKILPK